MATVFLAFGFLASPLPSARAEASPGLSVQMLDAEGHPLTLAGAHPDVLRIGFSLEEGTSLRDLELALPTGLGGSPNAVPPCSRVLYESGEECPPESQVGVARVAQSGGSTLSLPLFQLEPLPGEVLAIGSKPSFSLPLVAQIRPDDFGITLVGHELPPETIGEGEFELWGVPADHQVGTLIPRRPFLTAPTTCGPVIFGLRARTWAEGAPWVSASSDTGVSLTGCEDLTFEPRLDFALSEARADSPTGLSLTLNIPGEAEGSERAPAEARSATIKFPSGVTISPGGAEGLVACTDAQLGLGNAEPARCPSAAKIGSAEMVTDTVAEPLTGTIYMGEGHPGEPMRTFLVMQAPGATFKFVSATRFDSSTGRILALMDGLPQVPIQRISLNFDGGPQALFATPLGCGRTSATATIVPYGGGPSVTSSAPVEVSAASTGAACAPPPFSPQFQVTSSSLRAGSQTTISTVLRRGPGEQLLRSFSATLPAGVSARLGTVTPCPSAAASAASCPATSLIGSATATIGSGANPATLHGSVYLTGPYMGSPLGVLTLFSGKVGPVDLGLVATRSTLRMQPHSGRLTVAATGIPDQVEGMQVRFQGVELDMNRPGFLRTPTACSPPEATAVFESQDGTMASAASAFQVRGCRRLGFRPRIRLALIGRRGSHGGAGLALRVKTRLPKGDANLRAMKLILPPALKLGTRGLKELCSRRDAISGTCPSDSRIGSATARTPSLKGRLRGAVYMAQPRGRGLPDLWVTLAGSGLRMEMASHSKRLRSGRYATVLSRLPDTSLLAFEMRLGGTDSRIVRLRGGFCESTRPRLEAHAKIRGQNGKRTSFSAPIRIRGICRGARE